MEDEDEFFDTASLTSSASAGRRRNDKGYLSLSRNTIYHSAVDLEMEMDHLNAPSRNQPDNKSWRNFSKGDLCVDFVLAYEDSINALHKEKREIFERRLEDAGLILEREAHQKINFVKIHAPFEVLCQYAEILKLRLPIRTDTIEQEDENIIESMVSKTLDYCHIRLDAKKFPEKRCILLAPFSKSKDYLFDTYADDFFAPSTRVAVASYILQREKFGEADQDKGIKKLIAENVYKAAYPLHDGDIYSDGSQRKLLNDEWASITKWIKYQPIDNIKEYFGPKIALYFTWLGFYTHMLIPASIVGTLCILYGLATLRHDVLVGEVCNSTAIMCPLCDKICDYWELRSTCTYSKIIHVIDNPATIFFAVFMSFWAALYIELWKRYSAKVIHRWGLTNFDSQCEPPRPEYLTKLAKAEKQKLNNVTQLHEPVVPFWRVKLPSLILSFTVAIFWVLLAIAVVFGIVIYRMAVLTSDTLCNTEAGYAQYLIPLTAGLLNLVCILILNRIYNYLAQWLTEHELQRTQTEFDESLALKIYMFQFVNYYSCIFYIAFLKGKWVGYPAKYNRIYGFRQEECMPGGCLVELCIQLCIIMVGNQAMNSVIETIMPLLWKIYNSFKIRAGLQTKIHSEECIISCNQWTEDYKLSDSEPQGLFNEYLEMVLQYGFVTIFVTACPLAPLFALINNVLEMRLDASKMLKYYRRPVPQRVKDIGVWLPIMDVIGRIAVISNAFIIAFSSHFIPQMVYALRKENTQHTLDGYLNFSLARFYIPDFEEQARPELTKYDNISICRYSEFRNPPHYYMKYKRPLEYWHILAARLAFIVIYQNFVGLVISAVQWAVPDVPNKLRDRIQREAYRTNEIIIKHETQRANACMRRRPDSIISTYSDANGDVPPEGSNGVYKRSSLRNSLYHDTIG